MSNNIGASYSPPNIVEMLRQMEALQRLEQVSSTDKVKQKLGENCEVIDADGKVLYSLNARLVLSQNIDASELRYLKLLHHEKNQYFKLMQETDEPVKLKEYAHEVECIEFEMQKAWHFPQDKNFHEWYKVPKCECPKLDNADSRGSSHRVINLSCPIHGS